MKKKHVEMKCVKCGLADFRKKYVWMSGSADFFNLLEATAYICNKCGYIELFAT